ncbi:hypothetical protein WAI453_002310 [Rhynchosporium graminicola]
MPSGPWPCISARRKGGYCILVISEGSRVYTITLPISAIPQSHHDGDSDGSLTRLRLTLTDDKFPNNTNNTAVSNYWTTSSHAVATIGRLTGAATGRQTTRTATDYDIFTSLTSASPTASGSGVGHSKPNFKQKWNRKWDWSGSNVYL